MAPIRKLLLASSALALAACSGTTNSSNPTVDAGKVVVDAGPQGLKPVITAVTPATGPTDGGTLLTIDGVNFASGATARLGGTALVGLQFVSSTRLTGSSPAGVEGKADLVVVNPDSRLATLAQAFTYVAPAASAVGWCNLQFPTDTTLAPGAPLELFGRVFALGITDKAGQGAGITMQAGLSDGDGGWSWSDGGFNVDADNGANDEYRWAGSAPAAEGSYLMAWRARLGTGDFTYCHTDGPKPALDPSKAGKLAVKQPPPGTVDWCVLQSPARVDAEPNGAFDVYAQVYEPGVTDGAGKGTGVELEFGLTGDDGGFTWRAASYASDQGNNDEWKASATAPATEGTRAYAFRARLAQGPWRYCQLDGPHDALVDGQSGRLETRAVVPAPDYCVLQFPTAATVASGASFDLFGQVYEAGVTEPAGQGAGLAMEMGISLSDGGIDWQAGRYGGDRGNNDEWQATLTAPTAPGSYTTLVRAKLGAGPWRYCGTDGLHELQADAPRGALTVEAVRPPEVAYCNLQFPLDVTVLPGATVDLYGQVYAAGRTEAAGQGPGVAMEHGIGFDDGGWTWAAAAWFADRGNNDEWKGSVTAPATAGTARTAFRASLDGGPWRYCEKDGLHETLDLTQAGTITAQPAAPPSVDWCNFQFPSRVEGLPGASFEAYGRVFAAGRTSSTGAAADVEMQFGLLDGDGGFTFSAAPYQGDVDGLATGDHANDEHRFQGTFPASEGAHAAVFRARIGTGPWTLCQLDGPHATYDASQAALVISTPPRPDWCALTYPTQATATPGQDVTLYGQVFEPGRTEPAGAASNVRMEAGFQAQDGGWVWGTARYNVDIGNNDEWLGTLSGLAAGSYPTLYRASVDTGPWSYCGTQGPSTTVSGATPGSLTVR